MEQGNSLPVWDQIFFISLDSIKLIHNFFVDPDDLVRDGQRNKQGEWAIAAVGYIGIDLFSHKNKKLQLGSSS